MEARMKKPKTIKFITMLALIFFCIPSVKAVEVDIPDPGLEVAIRAALGIGPDDPITEEALETLTSLYAVCEGITDLTGLQYCVNLGGAVPRQQQHQ